MSFINKFQRFMYGRYGIDDLYKFLFKIYIILFMFDIFLNNIVLTIIQLLIFVIMFYRFFSKNTYKRNKENKMFLKLKNKVTKPFSNIKRNLNDKEHIYKKCHKCGTTLKLPLPSSAGIKKAKCPNCKKRVKFLTFRKQKIEIIKNKKNKAKEKKITRLK